MVNDEPVFRVVDDGEQVERAPEDDEDDGDARKRGTETEEGQQ